MKVGTRPKHREVTDVCGALFKTVGDEVHSLNFGRDEAVFTTKQHSTHTYTHCTNVLSSMYLVSEMGYIASI